MPHEDTGTLTVLAVDDDRDLAETYALWLDDEYDVRIATGGEDALGELDGDVDVVLLDRRMPGPSGREVLERIRDSDVDCRVAMLTAVEPSDDIVDMPFDEYVTKPVTRDELVETVESLATRLDLDGELREYYAVTSKIAALECELAPEKRESNEALDGLRDRADALEGETREILDDLEDAEDGFREADP